MGRPASRSPVAADHDAVMATRCMLPQQIRRDAARAAVLCECGHPLGDHRELPRESYAIENGAMVVTPNPDYRPLHFHCEHDDCACVIART